MFSFFKHFPILEIMFSNSPIAFVITKNRQVKIHKIKPILGKFFLTDEGFFVIDPAKSLGIYKQRVYLYNATNINPMPADKLAELSKLEKTADYDTFMENYNRILHDDGKEPVKEESDLPNPIDPTTMKILNEWGACDPQLFTVGTTHLLTMEKLIKKRTGAMVTKIPLTIIIVGIAVVFVMLIFGPQIMDMLSENLGLMSDDI